MITPASNSRDGLLVVPGVVQRPFGRDQRETRHPVGLRDEPARQVFLDLELRHLAGETGRVAARRRSA